MYVEVVQFAPVPTYSFLAVSRETPDHARGVCQYILKGFIEHPQSYFKRHVQVTGKAIRVPDFSTRLKDGYINDFTARRTNGPGRGRRPVPARSPRLVVRRNGCGKYLTRLGRFRPIQS